MKKGQILRKAAKEFNEISNVYHGFSPVYVDGRKLKPIAIDGENVFYTSFDHICYVIAEDVERNGWNLQIHSLN